MSLSTPCDRPGCDRIAIVVLLVADPEIDDPPTYLCADCLVVTAERMKRTADEYARLIGEGVDPAIAERLLRVRLEREDASR